MTTTSLLDQGRLTFPHDDEFFGSEFHAAGWPEAVGYHPKPLAAVELAERLEIEKRHDAAVELAR